ncbi:hypothetical protein ACO0K9_04435 [Undibacterium sp. Ji50W]|uniref:hypothetical protein n=1 Tax=Undibacterium sp. Ji50W TaxID=3413041 RepID=UPI003BF27254
MKNKERYRLILAIAISPSVPILTLATLNWQRSGSTAWFPILLVLGYACFFLLGLPIAGILIKKKTLLSAMLGGACASIAPIFLLDLLSLFSAGNVSLYALLFITGSVGGALFWLIAFFDMQRHYCGSIDLEEDK